MYLWTLAAFPLIFSPSLVLDHFYINVFVDFYGHLIMTIQPLKKTHNSDNEEVIHLQELVTSSLSQFLLMNLLKMTKITV